MDRRACRQHHSSVRVLPHIKRLDDCFGQFLVRVICDCGACREIEPETRAAGRLEDDTQGARAADALLEVREEGCRGGGGCQTKAPRRADESALAVRAGMSALQGVHR
jgi:hypothetical protein